MQRLAITSAPPPVPDRPRDGHKGTFGTVIVAGGSATMIGAPALCAGAAFRSGAGLVKVATLAAIIPAVLSIEPSATALALDDGLLTPLEHLDHADPNHHAVLAVGPGLGRTAMAAELVHDVLTGRRTVVLDADGLNTLAASGARHEASGPPLVLTPHPGEFKRLAKAVGIAHGQRAHAAAELAQAQAAVVVLKGADTVVTDGKRLYVNATGGPALATAGSGDVLTGVVAALLAQGMPPFEAAVLGVYLHGSAGDLWTAAHGPSGLTAFDLTRLLPDAFERRRRDLPSGASALPS